MGRLPGIELNTSRKNLRHGGGDGMGAAGRGKGEGNNEEGSSSNPSSPSKQNLLTIGQRFQPRVVVEKPVLFGTEGNGSKFLSSPTASIVKKRCREDSSSLPYNGKKDEQVIGSPTKKEPDLGNSYRSNSKNLSPVDPRQFYRRTTPNLEKGTLSEVGVRVKVGVGAGTGTATKTGIEVETKAEAEAGVRRGDGAGIGITAVIGTGLAGETRTDIVS